MRFLIVFTFILALVACKKENSCFTPASYRFIKGNWKLVETTKIWRNTYYNSSDTIITQPQDLSIEFGKCYNYTERKNGKVTFSGSGVFETEDKKPNFKFSYDLDEIDNLMINNLLETSATSNYFKVDQDTLWAIGQFIFYSKNSVPGGTAYVDVSISHKFIRIE